MFKREVKVTVELSEEARHALAMLDGDIEGLRALVEELTAAHRTVLEMVKGEIAVHVADVSGKPLSAVHVFEDEADESAVAPTVQPSEPPSNGKTKSYPKPPGAMVTEQEWDGMDPDDPNRVRATPFTRAPRHAQVEWLMQILGDQHWHAPIEIARNVANDERHYRYLRSAIGGRFKEMHEEGLVVRRDSHVKGSMYEYRLKGE